MREEQETKEKFSLIIYFYQFGPKHPKTNLNTARKNGEDAGGFFSAKLRKQNKTWSMGVVATKRERVRDKKKNVYTRLRFYNPKN